MHGLIPGEPVGGEDGKHRFERLSLGTGKLGIVGVREPVGPHSGRVEPGAFLDEGAVGLGQTEYSFVGRLARRGAGEPLPELADAQEGEFSSEAFEPGDVVVERRGTYPKLGGEGGEGDGFEALLVARAAAASTTASLLNPALGDTGGPLSHALEVGVLERGRVLKPVAHGPVHSNVREPDQRHGYYHRACDDHAQGANHRGNGVGVERVVDGGTYPRPGKIAKHREVGREQQCPKQQPASSVYLVQQHAYGKQGDALESAAARRAATSAIPPTLSSGPARGESLLPSLAPSRGESASFTKGIRL